MVHTSSDEKEKAIFHAARSMQDAAQREIYLEAACGGDHELRMQVDSLLSATEDAGDFLESPPLDSHVRVDPREFGEAAGTTIGPYKLLEQIGEGGFGAVYMAEQLEPIRRRVALKIIKAGMDTKQVIARFEAERQALALMDHPNIAKVLDAGTTDTGLPYFVMELVRGVPVIEYCDERSLPTEDRLTLFCEVCLAIQHAHQKGIIHRDIKPNNVLVTTNGDQPVPKVIDFGIAKATQGRLTDKTLFTQFRQFIGTPAYMSPEQAQMSAADIDTRSDIYSLGVLLYELLTGKTPLDTKELLSSGFDEVCRRIREEEPLKPSTRLSTMSQAERVTIASKRKIEPDKLGRLIRGELDWIIMKAIEKDRGRRYETANGLAQDIKRFLSNEPVMAAAPSPLYHFQKFARRNKVALATTGVIGAVMIAAVTVSTWQAIRATNASQSERKARIEAEGAKEQALTAKNEADKQSDRAEAGEFAARENLYVAEMNVAQRAVEEGNIDRAIDILERHVPEPGVADLRGFEWRYLWRQSHRELFSIQSRGDPIYDLAFSPDGRLLASASRFGWVRIWDFSARREVFHFQVASRTHTWVAFSPDGGTIAVATLKSPDVFLWDVNRQTEVTRFSMAPARSGSEIAFSPDGSVLVAGASDGNVWFWDIASEEGVTVKRHDSGITGLSISADGARLATSSQDGAVKVWDYARRDVLHTLLRSNDEAMFVVISPNGDLVGAVPRYSPIATVWDANTGVPVTELRVWFQSHGLLFSPDGKTLALTEYAGGLTFYNTKTWEEITIYHHPGHQLNTIAFSPDGDVIVSAGDNGTIMAWPARPDPDLGLLMGHPWGIIAVMYSPDSSVIAVGTGEGSVTLWDAATEAQLYSTPASTDERGVIPHFGFRDDFFAFSPDGSRLAVSTRRDEANMVVVWDIRSQKQVDFFPHDKPVQSLVYSPDGTLLATGTADEGTIRLWDLESKQVVKTLDEQAVVECLAFSPDSTLLASEGWGQFGIHVWSVTTGECVATLKGHVEPVGDNHSLAFSPDGTLLATAGYDRKVILWDTKTWKKVKTLLGHMNFLMDLSFSPDGRRLASSAVDGWAKVWDIKTGQEVARFKGIALDFSPDGNTLAVGGENGSSIPFGQHKDAMTVRLYRAATFEQIDEACDK